MRLVRNVPGGEVLLESPFGQDSSWQAHDVFFYFPISPTLLFNDSLRFYLLPLIRHIYVRAVLEYIKVSCRVVIIDHGFT